MAQDTRTRAAELADRFEAVNDAIIETVSASTPEHWQRSTAAEGWPVGVVAHHVAQTQASFRGMLAGLAAGETPLTSVKRQDIDEGNARHAREFAEVGQPETLAALRENGAALASQLRGLDDEALARVPFAIDGQELTAEQVIEFALIRHFQEHLDSIRATR